MTISENYFFNDFTLGNYKRTLEFALVNNYEFQIFTDGFNTSKSGKTIFLRHDIEFSIDKALKMAEIENSLGIKSMYFVQLHSVFYNPLDKRSFESIKKIIGYGHQLGLHFDTHFWDIKSEKELEKYLYIDKNVLQNYFDLEIKMFSFHRTNLFILSCNAVKYSDMINVYSKEILDSIDYCSDSLGYWRYERLEDKLLNSNNSIQVLIHDGMWQEKVLSPRKRIHKVIEDRSKYIKKYYDEVLRDVKAENIDWNGPI